LLYNTLLGILFSSILYTCTNQRNLFHLIGSVMVGFLTIALISVLVNIVQFSYSLSYTGSGILLYIFL
jgi:predicted branched-subunit amino acid permease